MASHWPFFIVLKTLPVLHGISLGLLHVIYKYMILLTANLAKRASTKKKGILKMSHQTTVIGGAWSAEEV